MNGFFLLQMLRKRISPPPGKALNFLPVATYHCFFLRAAPPFDLAFSSQRFIPADELFLKNQFNRESRGRIACKGTAFMLCYPFVKVFSVPCVVGTVSATEYVNPETHIDCQSTGTSFPFMVRYLTTNGKEVIGATA